MSRAGPNDDDAHYWSYRALLEDKRRCLATIPREKDYCRDFGNTLQKEHEDCKISHKAMTELKRHMAVTLDRDWDPKGVKTPPHAYLSDENRPHFSQKEFNEKKKYAQTAIRRPASARPKLSSTSSNDLNRDEVFAERTGPKRAQKDIVKLTGRKSLEAPTMKMLMQPGGAMDRKYGNEREALTERRSSSVPHDSYEAINWKKKFHATKLHARKPQRSQSARDVSRGSSEIDSNPDYNVQRDPCASSYQGAYPNGTSSEAWPQGRSDPKQSGRYQSQAYFMVDKRRHAAAIDGDLENEKARSRDRNENNDSIYYDEDGFSKSDATKDRLKYRSQYALAQHKRRHLCDLYKDGDDRAPADGYSQASPRTPYSATSPRMDGLVQQDLFTSHKNLEYGKRGHVVTLNSARDKLKTPRSAASGADSESSCDVGKGISTMMHKHDEDKVHTSNALFAIKKKNHATSVHILPKPAGERATEEDDEETAVGKAETLDKRRPSDPHHSHKGFEMKKKYHQTCLHKTADSKLHPDTMKARSSLHPRPGGQTIPKKDPGVMDSQRQLNEMKRLHMFEYDPESRVRPAVRPIPTAPVPRNGQWTPQHVCD